MSAAAAPASDATTEAKPKSKKLLFIIMGVVVLALAGAGGAFFILKKNTSEHEDGADEEAVVEHAPAHDPGTPPTFLPLDSMVVNLADPGGNRFVQLAITLQVQDAATSEAIKPYMPSIRNGILMLVSQRTAEEILKPEGKEGLVKSIIEEISGTMGYEIEEAEEEQPAKSKKKRRRAPPNPLQGVLFSSFIVQ